MVNKLKSNQTNIIVSIVLIFIFEYVRNFVDFNKELFPNLIMTFALMFIITLIHKQNSNKNFKIQNLGISLIIITLLEVIRVENNFVYINYIIISIIEYGLFKLISLSNRKQK